MTESNNDLDARLRAFFSSAAVPPTPRGLEDRIVARLGRRRFPFLRESSPRVAVTALDHPFSAPSGRAARLGAVTAALGTAVALAAVGLVSHHAAISPGGAGAAVPARQLTATASPVDLSGARAATAAFFDPSLPQCWKDPAVKGMAPPIDSYARCPVTSRLGNHLRAEYGILETIAQFRTPAPQPGVPAPAPSSLAGWTAPHYTVTVGAPIATSTGATVKVLASDQTDTYANDAVLVHTSAGWLIDDILIHGRNMPYPIGHAPHPGAVHFMPDASGFPVSVYNQCTAPTATAPATSGC